MIGDILKYLRLCNDLSVGEVAKKLGHQVLILVMLKNLEEI